MKIQTIEEYLEERGRANDALWEMIQDTADLLIGAEADYHNAEERRIQHEQILEQKINAALLDGSIEEAIPGRSNAEKREAAGRALFQAEYALLRQYEAESRLARFHLEEARIKEKTAGRLLRLFTSTGTVE